MYGGCCFEKGLNFGKISPPQKKWGVIAFLTIASQKGSTQSSAVAAGGIAVVDTAGNNYTVIFQILKKSDFFNHPKA
jgi:hypothetical protein